MYPHYTPSFLASTYFPDSEICSAVAWSPDGQLLSCSDDKTLWKWSADGEKVGKIPSLNFFATNVSWFPASGKQVH